MAITGAIETTTDGSTWVQERSGTTQYVAGIMCPSVGACLVAAGTGTLRFTANSGATWAKQVSNSTSYLRAPSCADLSTCVVVGDGGTILTSSTYGVTTTDGYSAAITPNAVLTVTTPGQVPLYYSYDQTGDTKAITNGSSLTTTLQYDSQARPITITLTDGTLITMTYNSAGQRAGYTVSKGGLVSESEQFSYQGEQLAQAVISHTQVYTDRFLYNGQGAPLELLRKLPGQNAFRYWYVLDGRGDVVALTDSSGSVVDRYAYGVWGSLVSSSEAVPQRLRYAGYWYDQELNWYWAGVRYYSPSVKRWLQPDPSQLDGVRTYVYVGDDPTDRSDPSGLFGCAGQHGLVIFGIRILPACASPKTHHSNGGRTTGAAAGGFVWLYRAVGPQELDDVLRFGDYGYSPNASGKYFAYKAEDARIFARGGRLTITRIRVPEWFIDRYGYRFDDFGRIPSVHFADEHLPDLYKLSGRPDIVEAKWVPPLGQAESQAGNDLFTDLEKLLLGESEGEGGTEGQNFLSGA